MRSCYSEVRCDYDMITRVRHLNLDRFSPNLSKAYLNNINLYEVRIIKRLTYRNYELCIPSLLGRVINSGAEPSLEEVERAISSLRNSSPGENGLSALLLKNAGAGAQGIKSRPFPLLSGVR